MVITAEQQPVNQIHNNESSVAVINKRSVKSNKKELTINERNNTSGDNIIPGSEHLNYTSYFNKKQIMDAGKCNNDKSIDMNNNNEVLADLQHNYEKIIELKESNSSYLSTNAQAYFFRENRWTPESKKTVQTRNKMRCKKSVKSSVIVNKSKVRKCYDDIRHKKDNVKCRNLLNGHLLNRCYVHPREWVKIKLDRSIQDDSLINIVFS